MNKSNRIKKFARDLMRIGTSKDESFIAFFEKLTEGILPSDATTEDYLKNITHHEKYIREMLKDGLITDDYDRENLQNDAPNSYCQLIAEHSQTAVEAVEGQISILLKVFQDAQKGIAPGSQLFPIKELLSKANKDIRREYYLQQDMLENVKTTYNLYRLLSAEELEEVRLNAPRFLDVEEGEQLTPDQLLEAYRKQTELQADLLKEDMRHFAETLNLITNLHKDLRINPPEQGRGGWR